MSGERSSRVDVVCLLAVTVGATGVCSLLTILLTTYYVHTLNTDVLQTSNIRELPYDLQYNAGLLPFTVYGDPLFEVYMSCARDSRF